MKNDMRISRRGALKVGTTLAAGAFAGGGLAAAAAAEDLRRFEHQPAIDPDNRILLKGGTIVSMDPRVGDLATGDLLIEGTKIAAIAPAIDPAGAQVIEANHHRAGLRRLPPPFLGSAASPQRSMMSWRSFHHATCTFSHGSVIDHVEAASLGLSIEYLKPEDPIWQRVWLLFCMYEHDCRRAGYLKIFEGRYRSTAIAIPPSAPPAPSK